MHRRAQRLAKGGVHLLHELGDLHPRPRGAVVVREQVAVAVALGEARGQRDAAHARVGRQAHLDPRARTREGGRRGESIGLDRRDDQVGGHRAQEVDRLRLRPRRDEPRARGERGERRRSASPRGSLGERCHARGRAPVRSCVDRQVGTRRAAAAALRDRGRRRAIRATGQLAFTIYLVHALVGVGVPRWLFGLENGLPLGAVMAWTGASARS